MPCLNVGHLWQVIPRGKVRGQVKRSDWVGEYDVKSRQAGKYNKMDVEACKHFKSLNRTSCGFYPHYGHLLLNGCNCISLRVMLAHRFERHYILRCASDVACCVTCVVVSVR